MAKDEGAEYRFPIRPERFIEREYDYPQALHAWVVPDMPAAAGKAYSLPADVTIEDLGTPSLDLPAYLAGYDTVIFIDAVKMDAPPGTIRVFSREEIVAASPGIRISPHEDGAVGGGGGGGGPCTLRWGEPGTCLAVSPGLV